MKTVRIIGGDFLHPRLITVPSDTTTLSVVIPPQSVIFTRLAKNFPDAEIPTETRTMPILKNTVTGEYVVFWDYNGDA